MKTNLLKKNNNTQSNSERSFYALGTLNHIRISGSLHEQLLDSAIQRVRQIEEMMSAYQADSDVSKLNRNAGKGFVPIRTETFELIKKSIAFSEMSQGAFDITIRPLTELWRIGKQGDKIPDREDILRSKKLADYRKIILDEKSQSAALTDQGQAIDLGGIAKGYAADEVKRILSESEVKSALVNLGGNILAIGAQEDGAPWRIGIQTPTAPTGKYFGSLSATDQTIVTSGSNERFFMKDGVRYHHILDPRTGMPAQTGLLSVTAVCGSSADADALTTSVFVLGAERGMDLMKRYRAEVIFVTENLDVIVSNGLKDQFHFYNNNEK